jgi:hypothetical protein
MSMLYHKIEIGIETNNDEPYGEDIIKLKNVVCYHIDANNYHCHHTYNNT